MTNKEKEAAIEFLKAHLGISEELDIKINEPLIKRTFLKLHPVYNSKYGSSNKEIQKSLLDEFAPETSESTKNLHITADGLHGRDFYLEIDDNNGYIYLMNKENSVEKANRNNAIAYWDFKSLEDAIKEAYPAALFAEADSRTANEEPEFRFSSFKIRKTPSFMTFLLMVRMGYVRYEIKISDSLKRFSSEQRWSVSGNKKDIEKILSMLPVIDAA